MPVSLCQIDPLHSITMVDSKHWVTIEHSSSWKRLPYGLSYGNFPETTGMEAVSPPSTAKSWPFT